MGPAPAPPRSPVSSPTTSPQSQPQSPTAPSLPVRAAENTQPYRPLQKLVVCPACYYQQAASLQVLSIFCKNCNRRINLEGQGQGRMPAPAQSSLRPVSCPGCQATQEVPSNALSAFCQKCGKRINMQDYQIRGKFNGDIQTKGTLTVALGGDVHADVHVGNAIIEGKLFGTVRADGKVELRSTGYLREMYLPKRSSCTTGQPSWGAAKPQKHGAKNLAFAGCSKPVLCKADEEQNRRRMYLRTPRILELTT